MSEPEERDAGPNRPPAEASRAAAEQGAESAPPPGPLPPALPAAPARPSLAGFDKWIQKRALLTMGSVIVIAFLAKAFVPGQFAFTTGLVAGAAFLIALYLAEFYRGRPGR